VGDDNDDDDDNNNNNNITPISATNNPDVINAIW
jgi:hypothetical protein